jgi:hypothetical protein
LTSSKDDTATLARRVPQARRGSLSGTNATSAAAAAIAAHLTLYVNAGGREEVREGKREIKLRVKESQISTEMFIEEGGGRLGQSSWRTEIEGN